METIKNYLDGMFASYPNTPEVLRAKDELWQMMEDKYTELIADGKSENEAVGTVISEFGNLSELAEALGLEKEVQQVQIQAASEAPKRVITEEEARGFVSQKKKSAVLLGLGVGCFIVSVVAAILASELLTGAVADVVSFVGMFGMITAGVLLCVFAAQPLKQWNFIRRKTCALSMEATKFVLEEQQNAQQLESMQVTFGVLCCAMCWMPAAVIGMIPSLAYMEDVVAASLFALVAIGVYLLINAAQTKDARKRLLSLNGADTVAANMQVTKPEEKEYRHPVIGEILSVYWPTIVCAYLIWSFLTFQWGLTWIIWPLAVVVFVILDRVLRKQ